MSCSLDITSFWLKQVFDDGGLSHLECKSMDWFLYSRDLCHESVKHIISQISNQNVYLIFGLLQFIILILIFIYSSEKVHPFLLETYHSQLCTVQLRMSKNSLQIRRLFQQIVLKFWMLPISNYCNVFYDKKYLNKFLDCDI